MFDNTAQYSAGPSVQSESASSLSDVCGLWEKMKAELKVLWSSSSDQGQMFVLRTL